MARVEPSQLLALQRDVDHIRNFCILAHVDHGKTTLSDSLVSSNGIISQRLAGKLRFLDSTEEEQKRGITMHSSAIALLYQMEEKGETKTAEATKEEFLINLVDSPGHIDFSSDVSTAARLCDGALVVVDVLEGVCTQTHAVIYKALRERMKPCLVLNKIDRLAVESRLSPTEAFHHLRRLVENVNALAFTLVKSELLKEAMEDPAFAEFQLDYSHPLVLDWTFAAEKGNVQFTSALDSWGFGLMKFVNLAAKRFQLNKNVLRQYLFEDYHLNLETKKISKADGSKAPLFATLVLEPLWRLYELCVLNPNLQELVVFAKDELGVVLPPREVNPRDPRGTLQSVARRWLPLAESLLRMVVRSMPSPKEAQQRRAETLVAADTYRRLKEQADGASEDSRCLRGIETCDARAAAPVVVFVSKMVPVKVSELSKQDLTLLNQQRAQKMKDTTDEGFDYSLKPDQEVFLAVGRVFSGELRRDSDLFVLSQHYDAATGETKSTATLVGTAGEERLGCYLMLGPSVAPATSVPAGNIVGIVGLEDYVLKTATLSSSPQCFPLKAITFQAKPMLKVAVDVLSHKDLRRLEQGLQALYQFDPVVEVRLEDNGHWTMTCLGELHLDQCVKALTEKFMKSEVKVSEPLVSFRETILLCGEGSSGAEGGSQSAGAAGPASSLKSSLPPPWCDLEDLGKARSGRIRFLPDPNNPNLALTVRCAPLPPTASHLEQWGAEVKLLDEFLSHSFLHAAGPGALASFFEHHKNVEHVWKTFLAKVRLHMQEVDASKNSGDIQQARELLDLLGGAELLDRLAENVVSLGPHGCPTNLLAFHPAAAIEIYDTTVAPDDITLAAGAPGGPKSSECVTRFERKQRTELANRLWQRLHGAVAAGFQEAVLAGPLMHEPLCNVGFFVEKVELSRALADQVLTSAERGELYMGSNISAAGELIEPSLGCGGERLGALSSGQIISEVKTHLRATMLSCPVRIVEPVYQCDLQCDQSQLGNLYAVLSKRRGAVFKEDIIEGTSLFLLSAYLPVVQSFHFAQDLLKKTSGSGTAPQLSFSHWQTMAQDPFWRPRTEEELEEFGEQFLDEHNLARAWINKIRKRKGLAVDEQVVVFAEKQRTLNKKK